MTFGVVKITQKRCGARDLVSPRHVGDSRPRLSPTSIPSDLPRSDSARTPAGITMPFLTLEVGLDRAHLHPPVSVCPPALNPSRSSDRRRENGEVFRISPQTTTLASGFSARNAQGRRPPQPPRWRNLCRGPD